MYRIIIFVLLLASASYAAESYRLEADQIFGTDNVSFTAKGNVILTFKNSTVTADEATYYPQEKIIEATGRVTIKDEVQELTAERVVYDLDSASGDIDNATGTIAGEYYICAKYINRVNKDYYIMGGVRITTCSSPLPEWSFSFHRAEAEIDGYLYGDHATGNVLDMPFLYSPKLFFPLKFTRQTGFLVPSGGYDSDFGTYASEKFFWAVDYDKDITVGVNAFSARGFMWLGEARYKISSRSNIYVAGDRLNDAETNVDTDTRWRYVSKSRIRAPYNFELVADADMVSDYMYMRDFYEYGMYEPTIKNDENEFYEYYSLAWRSKYLNINGYYKDEALYRDTTTGFRRTSVTQQPSITLSKRGINLGYFYLDYNAAYSNVEYDNYRFNFNTPSIKQQVFYDRLYADMSVYKTFRLPIMKLTPSVTGYYTRWYNMDPDPTTVNEERETPLSYISESGSGYMRILPALSLKGNLNEIYKNYGKAKHGILNTVQYSFIQEQDQTGLPSYLDDDLIEGENELSWSMRNYYTYNRISADLVLKQPITFHEDDILAPLEIKSRISVNGYWGNNLEAAVDYYAYRQVYNRDPIALIKDSMWVRYKTFRATLSYDYNRRIRNNYNTSLIASASLTSKRIDLTAYMQWQGENQMLSVSQLVPIENRATIVWKDQCWNLGIGISSDRYIERTSRGRETMRDYKVEFLITLKGLGTSAVSAYDQTENYGL
ncbi:MAG: hypothetical protein LBV09_03800 [Deferribacteraceae bacterium]|jgi:lipopolysaccharide assembly outer membrane protein LptD (OstA)|nr:hypothetical protein [Deferribacteraceae bacterium]